MIVLPHGGVHSNFASGTAHIVRELVRQGYSVIATDYRGSTGYGGEYYRQIDYGGRESHDVFLGREWMLDNHPFLDPRRVGIVGWSHGGMIALMNIFEHPEAYAFAYAGVPVSDLVARMGYMSDGYRGLFSAPHHIGSTVREDVLEYRRRSPVYHVGKLATPLLIHTNTNDEDVNVLEVGAPDRGAQGRGEAVPIQGLPGRSGRPCVQPPGYEARAGIAARNLALPGGVLETGPAGRVDRYASPAKRSVSGRFASGGPHACRRAS